MAKSSFLSLLVAAILLLATVSQAFLAPSFHSRATTRAAATRLQAVADAKSPEEFDKVSNVQLI